MKKLFSSSRGGLSAGLPFDQETSVSQIMTEWPQTVQVFLRHKTLCVGCLVGPFHTISDACHEHGLDEVELWAELAVALA